MTTDPAGERRHGSAQADGSMADAGMADGSMADGSMADASMRNAERTAPRGAVARALRLLFLPASVVILFLAALQVPLPYFLEAPGEAVSLGELVVVDDRPAELDGDVLMLTVGLRRATSVRLARAIADPDVAVVADRRIVPAGVTDREFFDRQRDVFRERTAIAAAVALAAAGFDVDPSRVTGDGVLVVGVLPETPAEGVFERGDVIVAVDGEQVGLVEELLVAVRTDPPPELLRFSVQRGEQRLAIEVQPLVVQGEDGPSPLIGVQIETHNPRIDLPVSVAVEGGRTGGPSAGLPIALVVYDHVAADDLAAGMTIAATGALDTEGRVRNVGGVPQKAVVAERAGVDVLLVPAGQADAARASVGPRSPLRIVGVETFGEAVDALHAIRAAASSPGGEAPARLSTAAVWLRLAA